MPDSRHANPTSWLTRIREVLCSEFGHRWTPWERPLRLLETCRCTRCGRTRTRRLGLV